MEPVRWGILGTGAIAKQMAAAIGAVPEAELAAVGSRTLEKAREFAREAAERAGASEAACRPYGSYEELAANGDLDVVYVATPHPMHAENSLLCLENGKAVLCEKPFALNAAQARQIVAKARERGLFLMEAMWTRFFPIMVKLREILAEGSIGAVKVVAADFGFRADFDPESRLFDPALGGGALLDVGVYCVSLASMVLGPPNRVAATATLAPTGVDETSAYLLSHASGAIAALYSSVRAQTPWEADVLGESGSIRVHSPFWKPSKLTLSRSGFSDEAMEMPYEGNGYQFQVEEVCRCIRSGLFESPVMPLDETMEIMETLDAIREQIDVKYPGE